MKIKSLILDSSVIFDLPLKSMRAALDRIVSYYVEPSVFIKAYTSAFRELQSGEINSDKFFDQVFNKISLPARSQKRIIEQHNSERDKLVRLSKDIKSVISALSRDYKLGVASNMPRDWFLSDAKRLGLDVNAFSSMVFSSDAGELKGLLLRTCRELGSKPDRCVFITRHETKVKEAQKTGLTVITIGSEAGDLSADSASDLVSILTDFNDVVKPTHEVSMP